VINYLLVLLVFDPFYQRSLHVGEA